MPRGLTPLGAGPHCGCPLGECISAPIPDPRALRNGAGPRLVWGRFNRLFLVDAEGVVVEGNEIENPPMESSLNSASTLRYRFKRSTLILAICVASIGLIAAVLCLKAQQQPDGGHNGSSNNVLSVGLTTSYSIVSATQRVGISGELVNFSPKTLTLEGPIDISGTGGESGVHVLYAQIVKDASVISGVPSDAPPSLKTIPPKEHVAAVIGLEIDCPLWSARDEWPSVQSTATIGLAGFEAPATYSIPELFGSEAAVQIRELCS